MRPSPADGEGAVAPRVHPSRPHVAPVGGPGAGLCGAPGAGDTEIWDRFSVGANVVSPVFIGRRDELASLAGRWRGPARTTRPSRSSARPGSGRPGSPESSRRLPPARTAACSPGSASSSAARACPSRHSSTRCAPWRGPCPPTLADVLGPAAPALSRLLPELAKAASALSSSPAGPTALAGDDVSKAQLLEHVLGTLDRLSGVRPVLLAVEDLHWADRSTLDLMAFLFRSLRQSRVMIAVTYRSDELHRRHPLRPLLTSWERDRSINRIDLSRFSRDEVAAQLGAILGQRPAPAVTDTVFDRSGGNAYLVEELAGAVSAGGDPADLPPSLADVLLSRVDALTANAQKLLRTASVAGRAVSDGLLAEVAGLDEAELLRALRETVDSHLLVVDPSGHGYAFRHALTRDAVYEDMLPGERVRLHAAYAAALDRDPGLGGDDADAVRRSPTTGTPRLTCRARCPPRRVALPARRPRARPPRRCGCWSGRWRSGRGSRTPGTDRHGPGRASAASPPTPPTGTGRSTGRGRCSPTPSPSFRQSDRRTATGCGARCSSSATRSSSGTQASPRRGRGDAAAGPRPAAVGPGHPGARGRARHHRRRADARRRHDQLRADRESGRSRRRARPARRTRKPTRRSRSAAR